MRHLALSSPAIGVLASVVLGALVAAPLAADPPAPSTGTGTIEFRVLSTSDEVRFFIDGNRVPARKRTAAWHAARATIAVPAGEHTAEAKFRIAGASEDAPWISITTRSPIVVDPGSSVRLDADVRAARAGTAASDAHTFDVLVSRRGGAAVAQHSTDDVPVGSKASPAATGTSTSSGVTSTLVGGTVATSTIEPHVPAQTITIRGDEVVSDGRTVQPAATSETEGPILIGAGLVDDTPAVSDLAAEDTAPAAAVGAAAGAVTSGALVTGDAPSVPEPAPAAPNRFEVSFLVESEPADANVTLDGKSIGRTPLRVALDPRQDHLLVVERQGCESVVQLLATEAWRTGRAPQTTVRLVCK